MRCGIFSREITRAGVCALLIDCPVGHAHSFVAFHVYFATEVIVSGCAAARVRSRCSVVCVVDADVH